MYEGNGSSYKSNMSNIHRYTEKINTFSRSTFFTSMMWFFLIIAVTLIAFFLGMLYERQQQKHRYPITLGYSDEALMLWNQYQETKSLYQMYYASRNGSVVYPVGCNRGNTIKEENKIYFTNLQQALNQGYREATGC